ncbi:MAG: hypothetical protein COU90_04660 [Candidatus Ryanbacteria bacterium CG10_big_fil_rev_8_21_14_0_10_43_42]|uniref:Uncharacterized protein n=1 Tax=Candidatus Ryanbacteria bacterium CG10_big_fil_rev_8_21_14_0_10_43_42 TaxID=1974864 RepID=A0A2M8KW81_9BACT|nr:MAG: hypothetical protein COU90_04660 [Candidatus Ryanbacteria bacterium CG10_big_fil_rev_8_21_14_0_10_43_42]
MTQKAIQWNGWFVYTISGLARGDASIAGDMISGADIMNVLEVLDAARFSRTSRRGWKTMDHPDLGMLQWKSGVDFRTTGWFLFVKVNGTLILKAWPEAGHQKKTPILWVTGTSREISNKLGYLEK